MKKVFTSILLTSMFLFSCSNEHISSNNYTEKLKTDLQVLSSGPWESKVEDAKYTISFSHTLTKDELGHVYTIDLGYKNQYIDDIHVIVLPSSFNANPLEHNVPHVGYSQRINLAEDKNLEKNDRENIRLQIELVDQEENIYVSVMFAETIDLYKF
jgi:hypothetical protein